jgi:arsenate reductase (thioredoxin)
MRKKAVLFLCTGNSCRSQMAEGLCRHFRGDKYEAFSAGTDPHGLNPRAIKVMGEIGIDTSGHTSDTLESHNTNKLDIIFTVCDSAHENCPFVPNVKISHVGFEDPPRLTEGMEDEEEILAIYRRVRDEIKEFILKLDEYVD